MREAKLGILTSIIVPRLFQPCSLGNARLTEPWHLQTRFSEAVREVGTEVAQAGHVEER
jgi:hypothetical protein